MASKTETPAPAQAAATQQTQPNFQFECSRLLPGFLTEQKLSVALSTYKSGRLLFMGLKENGTPQYFNRFFQRVMGICVEPGAQSFWLGSIFQLWHFRNELEPGERKNDLFTHYYVPRLAYTTGDIDMHDIGVDNDGNPVFVSPQYSCLGRPSRTHSFEAIWKPRFISRLAAEDRCHLNGLAMRDGAPRTVSAVSTTDVQAGWREHRRDGGVLIDVPTGEIIIKGLSMPHSPRWHQGRLYVLNSGRGEFGVVDEKSGTFEPVCFCPGYARGLTFHNGYAFIGLSNCRQDRTFQGLPLDDALNARNVGPRCGLLVIDLRTGDIVHTLNILGDVRELYDVAVFPGVRTPGAYGMMTNEIHRSVRFAENYPA